MKPGQINNKHLNYLKVVLLSQLLLEANDELVGTYQYKQNLKQQVNRTTKILEGIVKTDFNLIYANNPEMCTNVLRKIDALVNKLKTASIDELVMIDAVVDKYNENKDWFTQHTNAEFLKLN